MSTLSGIVVIVTGAARGIGAAIARGVAEAGAIVVAVDELRCDNPWVQGDVTTPTVRAAAIEQASSFGLVRGLVNAAGVSLPDYWDRTLAVNLKAPVDFATELIARLATWSPPWNPPVSIVNVTSLGAHQGFPGNVAYQAAKGGLRAATKALARDWSPLGVRVNALVPGYTRTAMTEQSWADPVARQARTDRTLLGRWAEPEDYVGPAVFLLSAASGYVTGQDLVVDGGWLAKGL